MRDKFSSEIFFFIFCVFFFLNCTLASVFKIPPASSLAPYPMKVSYPLVIFFNDDIFINHRIVPLVSVSIHGQKIKFLTHSGFCLLPSWKCLALD